MNVKLAAKLRMTSEERKASIVDAACKLFSEKGFRGATTRELAAAVGVTEPVLYEHFKTKRDLYSAIIENKAQDGLRIVTGLQQQYTQTDDDLGFFTGLGLSILNWYTNDPTFIRLLLFSSLEGHELKDLFHDRSKVFFDIVANYIAGRIKEGRMRSVDPMIAARAFFGMVAHYALTGVLFGCAPFPQPPEDVVRHMVGIFLGGMCTQDTIQ